MFWALLEGFEEGEVTLLDLQPQDALVAWERGDIDAAYLWNPVLSSMKSSGGVVITDSDELSREGFPTADLAVARNDFISSHPELVQAWVDAQSNAVNFIQENPEQAAEIVSAEFGISVSDAFEQLAQVVLLGKAEQRSFFESDGSSGTASMESLLAGTALFLAEQKRIERNLSAEEVREGFTSRFLQD